MPQLILTPEEREEIRHPRRFGFGPAMNVRCSFAAAVTDSEVVAALSWVRGASSRLPFDDPDRVVFGFRPEGIECSCGLYVRQIRRAGHHECRIEIPRTQYEAHVGGAFYHVPPTRPAATFVPFISGVVGLMFELSRMLPVHQAWVHDEGSLGPARREESSDPGCYVFNWVADALSLSPVARGETYCRIDVP